VALLTGTLTVWGPWSVAVAQSTTAPSAAVAPVVTARVARGSGGIVVCADTIATRVGVQVLRDGGNALDAAVATALALAVTHPQAGNLGGGGFLVGFDAQPSETWAIDCRETAPAAADSLLYVRLDSAGVRDASLVGPLAAGIPGTPAGLHAAWEWHGALPWGRLVEPARALAADGFIVGRALPEDLAARAAELPALPALAPALFPGGAPPCAGDVLRQPDLARCLQTLQEEGPEPFYHGDIARELVAAVRKGGGLWQMDDLRRYAPRRIQPVRLPLQLPERPPSPTLWLPPWQARRRAPGRTPGDAPGHLELVTMPPPSSAAVVLGQTLALLRAQPAAGGPPGDPARAAALIEALRLAFADRNGHLADSLRMQVQVAELLAPAYLRERARLLPPAGRAGRSAAVGAGDPRAARGHRAIPRPPPRAPVPREHPDTTHLVVIDAVGNAVSLSTTLNDTFGSGWIAGRTGILLNDEMDDFDTRPGRPNLYGLVGSGRNAPAPGARMLSSMSPSLVLRDGEVWLALGASGGPRIPSAVVQVILYRVQDGMDLGAAVSAPRIHHQWLPDAVFEEEGRAWPGLRADLARMGYELRTRDFVGRVHAAERMADGTLIGAADGRDRGLALAVTPAPPR
jgi:gamma-glutamyltranspeptidase/glutathione hydrolase